MFGALNSVGVTNLQAWRAEIAVLGMDQVIKDYLVFNVVGTVRAADLKADQSVSRVSSRVFRLAESPSELIIDSVAFRALEAAGLRHLEIQELDEAEI